MFERESSRENHVFKKYFYWVVVITFLILIFCLSNQDSIQSNHISTVFVNYIRSRIPLPNIIYFHGKAHWLDYNHILRKMTHFIEYFLLACLLLKTLRYSGLDIKKSILLMFVLCIGYAISDELHQSFIAGRTPRLTDVMIDASGTFLSIPMYLILARKGTKK